MIPLYFAYFIFGFCFSFINVAVRFTLLKSGLTPSEMTLSWAIISSPWCFKPLYGLFSDRFPIFGFKRRPYICVSSFLTGIVFTVVPDYPDFTIGFLTLASFSLCIADVSTDSIMVEYVKDERLTGKLQSACWTYRMIGSFIATLIGGYAYTVFGYQFVLKLTSVFPFVLSLLIWNLDEEPSTGNRCIVRCPNITRLLVVCILYGFVPELDNIIFYKINSVGPNIISFINLSGIGACVIGTIVYRYWRGFRSTLIVASVLRCISIVVVWWAVKHDYVLIDAFIGRSVLSGLSEILFTLSIIVYTAQITPDGNEGTFYSFIMAVLNLSAVAGEATEGWVVRSMGITANNLDNLHLFVILAFVVSLLYLPVIFLLPSKLIR